MNGLSQAARWAVRLPVLAYRYLISPVLPGTCRYHPTCSAYALEAVDRHGAIAGSWLAAKRVCRCHPWGGHGFDPVPERGGDHQTRGGAAATEPAAVK